MSNQINLIPEGTKVWDIVNCRECVLGHSAALRENLSILPVVLPEYPYSIKGDSATIDGRFLCTHRNPRYSLTEFDYVNNTGKFTLLSYENYLALKKEEDAKKEEESLLPVGHQVWDIENQEWLTVENASNFPSDRNIKLSNGFYYTKEGKVYTDAKVPRISLTKYNWFTGEGKFTPISAYKEIKNLPPAGTPIFHIASQKWLKVDYTTSEIPAYKTIYPIGLIDEDGESFDTCTEDGYIDCTNEVPELSLTEFNYLKGTGKFTQLTEWRTMNS